jgi:uncharacterized protein YraI
MRRFIETALFAAILFSATMAAQAQNAYATRTLHVRAGPDRTYPTVAQVEAGAPVNVQGCLDDWSWCDVAFDDTHGWAYATGIAYVYEGDRVPLYTYAPSLGIPVVTFSLGEYWDRYYRGRPFYHEREQWVHRQMPPHMHPAEVPHREPPPHHAGGARPEPHAAPGPRPKVEEHAPPQHEHAPPQHAEGRPEERRPDEGRRDEHEEHDH